MRTKLEQLWGKNCRAVFNIKRFGNMLFEGNYIYSNEILRSPIIYALETDRFYPLRYKDKTTLAENVLVLSGTEPFFIDHLWIAENLEKYNLCIGDTVSIIGTIEKYQRLDMSFDFTIVPQTLPEIKV